MLKGETGLKGACYTSPKLYPRTQRKHWYVVALAGAVAGATTLTSCTPPSDGTATSAAERAVAEAQICDTAIATEQDALVARDAVLRRAPNAKAGPIVNPGAAAKPSDVEALATVTLTVPLRRSCDAHGWTRVRVVATGLRWMEGWVATSSLRSLKLDASGRRTLSARDIEWQNGSERDRAAIVEIANRILREDKRCEAIDNRSLLVEGAAGARRYTLSCDGPAGSFPIEFTAHDAASRSFAMAAVAPEAVASAPIDASDAGAACMDAIRSQLSQPKSADFHTFTDTTFSSDGSRSRFTVGFTAKNGFGNEVDSVAACIFDGSEMLSAEVLPSGS